MLPALALLASSFPDYLAAPHPPADGFDPMTRGTTAVHATAHGRVVHAGGDQITLEHVYYENHEKKVVRSEYGRLSRIDVKPGELVSRRRAIGASERLSFAIRSDVPTAEFLRARKKLFIPQDEPVLVLVDQEAHRLALYAQGKLQKEIEVGFGQRPGRKRRQGDLKTPKGMYFVVNQRRGEFDGPYGAYYGGHWIKINYPNPWDAAWGLREGLLERATVDAIRRDWSARKPTDQRTALGGGIGFHGWNGEWSWDDTGWLSWGCVVLHNRDIELLFDRIPIGAMVVLM